ncbi:hypothetical protein [Methylophaga pinxianii]|uniref:hypothetical protein n=1 Tax=Methylophaga pinxianii TaxID=2881052 RepID=UPI001CF12687|nr:hypothetical protein [Methylophaga pinxianii]MCB2425448.1 hypothetical protein [Methylophaga pinxianii]UPH46168.1 hypothetical protein LGT42_002480 [Methylophaga pinxianii]
MKLWLMFGLYIILIFILNNTFDVYQNFNSSLLKSFFGSNFITALAGAGFGAYAAFSMNQNISQRKEILDDIRNTNKAIVITAEIFRLAKYLNENAIAGFYINFNQVRQYNQPKIPLLRPPEVELDLRLLPIPMMEIKELKHIITKNISIDDWKILTDILSLNQSYQLLNECIKARELFIKSHISNPIGLTSTNRDKRMLGFIYDKGEHDTTMNDAINGMRNHTKDLLYLSYQVYSGLKVHGNTQLNRYKKINGKVIHNIVLVNYMDEAFRNGIVPANLSSKLHKTQSNSI